MSLSADKKVHKFKSHSKVKRIEKEIALTNSVKTTAFTKKWLIKNKTIP